MRAGAPESEGTDASEAARRRSRKRNRAPCDLEIEPDEINAGIEVLRMERRRALVMFERQHRLHEARQAGSGLGMTDIGLDRSDRQGTGSRSSQHRAERRGLDRIPDPGSGAVSLDEGDGIRRDASRTVERPEQFDLVFFRRHGDAAGSAVGIDCAAANHRMNAVAVGDRSLDGFQDEDDAALGAHVAIRFRGERPAQPGGREHRSLGKADKPERADKRVHAADQSHVDFAVDERLTGLVQGDERRRAGGVDRQARAVQIISVGNSV